MYNGNKTEAQQIAELLTALKTAKTHMYNLSMGLEVRPLHELFAEIDVVINKHS